MPSIKISLCNRLIAISAHLKHYFHKTVNRNRLVMKRRRKTRMPRRCTVVYNILLHLRPYNFLYHTPLSLYPLLKTQYPTIRVKSHCISHASRRYNHTIGSPSHSHFPTSHHPALFHMPSTDPKILSSRADGSLPPHNVTSKMVHQTSPFSIHVPH